MTYFVWINGLRGPEAQLWSEDVKSGDGKLKPNLFLKKLEPDEESKSLEELIEIYKDKKNG